MIINVDGIILERGYELMGNADGQHIYHQQNATINQSTYLFFQRPDSNQSAIDQF
jgi:hypothetical protein